MAHDGGNIEFENDRVKVTRVKAGQRGQSVHSTRHDRLIIYIQGGYVRRTEGGQHEEIRRKAGDVVWRESSQHQVENLEDANHHVLIVELKF